VSTVPATQLAVTDAGTRTAADNLFAALYRELHGMARRELAKRGGRMSLGATTLVHEAYLDISGRPRASFPYRHHFMAYASRVMRGIIIDHARCRHAQKRGGLFELTPMTAELADALPDHDELSQISDALDELATIDSRLAVIVDLKFFCGFSFVEIAGMQGVSERTVQRDWEKARIYLYKTLQGAASLV